MFENGNYITYSEARDMGVIAARDELESIKAMGARTKELADLREVTIGNLKRAIIDLEEWQCEITKLEDETHLISRIGEALWSKSC